MKSHVQLSPIIADIQGIVFHIPSGKTRLSHIFRLVCFLIAE